jgi:hypothetical protein
MKTCDNLGSEDRKIDLMYLDWQRRSQKFWKCLGFALEMETLKQGEC